MEERKGERSREEERGGERKRVEGKAGERSRGEERGREGRPIFLFQSSRLPENRFVTS